MDCDLHKRPKRKRTQRKLVVFSWCRHFEPDKWLWEWSRTERANSRFNKPLIWTSGNNNLNKPLWTSSPEDSDDELPLAQLSRTEAHISLEKTRPTGSWHAGNGGFTDPPDELPSNWLLSQNFSQWTRLNTSWTRRIFTQQKDTAFPLDLEQIRKYLGGLLRMAIVAMPHIRLYWAA